MNYIEYQPCPALNQWIEKIWYCHSGKLDSSVLTIPLLNHELVLNYSDHFLIHKRDQVLHNPKGWINGLQTGSYTSISSGRHEMLGVLFKPDGLSSFLPHDSSVFLDHFVDPGDVMGNCFDELHGTIKTKPDPTGKLRILENWMLNNLNMRPKPAYLRHGMNSLTDYGGQRGEISRICKSLSISNKSLIHSFDRHVGAAPLLYAHLSGISKAIHSISRDPECNLTSLAHSLNYFDQSHFIGWFKHITSLTPSRYANLVAEGKVDQLSPHFISIMG